MLASFVSDILHFRLSTPLCTRSMGKVLSLVLILSIAIFILCFILRSAKRIKWTHKRRIRRAEKVREILCDIDAKKGPGAQFAYMRKVDPHVVAEMVLSGLKDRGHRIQRPDRYTRDGGVDGECWIDGVHHLIQVKRYSGRIAARDVESFSTLCLRHEAQGLFVHTGRTGKGARMACDPCVDIVSGERLLQMLGIANQSNTSTPHDPDRVSGGADGTRTRDPRRDRPVF